MRVFTYWWGIHIVARTEEERDLLYSLHSKIRQGGISGYEDPSMKLIVASPANERKWMTFSPSIKNGELVLQISR